MVTVQILHNPRCSKSRATLALLEAHGIRPRIRLYLEDPPSATELRDLLRLLGRTARELMRKGEPEYRELGLNDAGLDETRLVEAMAQHPRLIERPIVLANGKAAVGRPPEAVLDIL